MALTVEYGWSGVAGVSDLRLWFASLLLCEKEDAIVVASFSCQEKHAGSCDRVRVSVRPQRTTTLMSAGTIRTKTDPKYDRRRSSRGSSRRTGSVVTIESGGAASTTSVRSHRSSIWERNTDSLRDMFERISAAQAVFEDSSRGRTMSSPECQRPSCHKHFRHYRKAEVPPTPLAGKILILVLMLIVATIALLYYLLRSSDRDVVSVEAKWCSYRGLKGKFEGRSIFTFLGIPFGANMSGTQRFRKPVMVQPPEVTILDVTHMKPSCNQAPLHLTHRAQEKTNPTSENCLHLNVWTPSLPSPLHTPKTVVVFLYSVAFKWGSNGDYDATPLSALGDIVVVVPNYRLHALGFLGDGSQDAPGNVALYDQLLALRWVQDNIEYFGGNASSIVLHGYESGAVSIGYHMVSPAEHWVKGISRLILQSGSPFRLYKHNTALSSLTDILGCARTRWACLRGVKEEDFRAPSFYRAVHFGPSFQTAYLPQHPQQLLRDFPITNKEVLLGNVLDEGSFLVEVHKLDMSHGVDVIGDSVITVHFKKELEAAGMDDFDSARRNYINNTAWDSELGNEAVKEIFGDALFNCPVQYLAEHLSDHGSSTYKYLWTYKPSFGPWSREDFGPTQYDDLAFVFGRPLLEGALSMPEEEELSRRTIQLFSGFAKTGDLPGVSGKAWPQYSRAKPISVEIGMKGLSFNSTFRVEQCSLLREYILKYK